MLRLNLLYGINGLLGCYGDLYMWKKILSSLFATIFVFKICHCRYYLSYMVVVNFNVNMAQRRTSFFQVPFGWMFAGGLFGPLVGNSGNMHFPSFVPNKLITARPPLSFMERFKGTMIDLLFLSSYDYFTLAK